MKKIFLLTILLFQLTFVFGQKTTKWSEWKTSNCFKGLQFSVKRESNEPDKQTNSYWWNIRFKNNYNRKVGFSCTLTIDGEKVINGRWDLSAGSEQSYTSVPCKSGNSIHNVDFSDVCFSDGSFDCAMGGKDKPCYAECDRGTPNIPKDCGGNSSNNQSSSSNNITHGSNGGGYNQKDDQVTKNQEAQRQEAEENQRLTDGTKTYLEYYNRATSAGQAGNYDEAISNWNSAISVAVNDAQRENAQAWLAEAYKAKNSSNIQRQNQENANNRQQFINIYNEGVQLGNMGNYNEAAAKYQQAIGLATNDSDRQTAQNAYNKISKANTQQQALTQLSSSIMDFAKSLEAAKEAKRLKREQERLAQEQQQKENELEAAKASEEMNAQWKTAIGYADLKKEESYKKAIDIMLPYATTDRLNGMALNTIGFWYYNLDDYPNAKKWYEQASNKDNNSCAMHNLGTLYENGQGVAVDFEEALKLYQQSCEKKDDTGCKQYEKLKGILEVETQKAKTTIANFKLKPYVDYLVYQCEKSGFKFDNISSYCVENLSKTMSIDFIKDDKKINTSFLIDYNIAYSNLSYLFRYLYYGDIELRKDFLKLQLSPLIGNKKISEVDPGGIFDLSKKAPIPIAANAFKGSKYRGFEKETTISNENTIDSYLHNANISCSSNEINNWLKKAAEAGDVKSYKILFYNHTLQTKTNQDFGGQCLLKYIEASSKSLDVDKLIELEQLAQRAYEADESYEKEERKNNKYNFHIEYYILCIKAVADLGGVNAIKNIAKIYENGTGFKKNYEQAVFYYSKLINDAESMCKISNLYKKGGNKSSNIFEKNNKLAKEWKKKSINAGGVCE